MNDELLNGDIEEPYERLIEECKWRKSVFGVDVCHNVTPCRSVIEAGKCDVLRKYFQNRRNQNENY